MLEYSFADVYLWLMGRGNAQRTLQSSFSAPDLHCWTFHKRSASDAAHETFSFLELLLAAWLKGEKGEEGALLRAYRGFLSSPLMTSLLDAIKGWNKPYKPPLVPCDRSALSETQWFVLKIGQWHCQVMPGNIHLWFKIHPFKCCVTWRGIGETSLTAADFISFLLKVLDKIFLMKVKLFLYYK